MRDGKTDALDDVRIWLLREAKLAPLLEAVRQLRDLRRYAPVVIQNAQQVNVGNQQLNVSG